MTRSNSAYSDLLQLESSAMRAGEAWACAFSSSDEFENALIRTRRARGHYRHTFWTPVAVVCGLAVVASAILMFN